MGDLNDELDFGGIPDLDAEQPTPVTCKRCGGENLEWVNCGRDPEVWRLYAMDSYTPSGVPIAGKLHVCKDDTASMFEAVAE